MNLQDGWFDGQGRAPDKTALAWVTEAIVGSFPEDLPFPMTAPTAEGGLFLEWEHSPWRVSVEFPLPERRCELQATNTTTGQAEDSEVGLATSADWSTMYEFVRRFC